MQIPSHEWNRNIIIFIGIICFVYVVLLVLSPKYDHNLRRTKDTHPEFENQFDIIGFFFP